IILIGGGGHCRSVIDAAESAGLCIAGVLERPGAQSGTCLCPLLGCDDDIPRLAAAHSFVITLGSITDPSRRMALSALVKDAGGRLASIVASTARVSPHARIGEGSVVLHHALVNACATVGDNCIINSGAIVEHDCRIGDFTHISTNATVNGGCRIGDRCFIGSGSVIAQGIEIADDVIIGAGSLVLHNISSPGKYHGIIK
ncbi:MAG: acetyltransferase, partial [Muribaculaceae bacterium]|nr:acetyltransferase [Muribaculaceae bacterium]